MCSISILNLIQSATNFLFYLSSAGEGTKLAWPRLGSFTIIKNGFTDCRLWFFTDSINLLVCKVVYGADVEEGLAGTFIASMFEEAAKDEHVIDIQKWVDQQYPATAGNRFTVE